MEINKDQFKKIFLTAAAIILFYWALQNYIEVADWFNQILGLFAPILLGLAIAFIINIPMAAIENRLLKAVPNRFNKFKRPVSLVLAMLLMVAVVVLVMVIIIPELVRTFLIIKESIPGFVTQVQDFLNDIIQYFPELQSEMTITIDWAEWGKKLFEWIQRGATVLAGSTFSVISATFSGVFTFVLGLVLAIYVLLQKEKLGMQAKKVMYAYIKEDRVEHLLRVLHIASRAFSNFFTGQCLEAIILGGMFFVTMSLFNLPYELMISVTIGFTALIPIFGAFLGCFIGAFLIVVTNPVQVIWFLILFFVLQQLEGNLIYPRVVGSSVGLPGIWVLIAVTLGGSMFGVLGMLMMVPMCSVVYTLLGESVNKRIKDRKISKHKIIKKFNV